MATEVSVDRHGSYGIDAPYVPAIFGGLSGFFVAIAVVNVIEGGPAGAVLPLIASLWFLTLAISFLYTTKRGKFIVWSRILDELDLAGDEQMLDLGCGRGAALLLVAQRLDRGHAVGVDLWRSQDQSGNAIEITRRNAEVEGVADRVQLETADMAELPFDDDRFDLVISSLAIHNIKQEPGRRRAIDEAVRVLRPGGRLAIADFRHIDDYGEYLSAAGASEVRSRGLGWRFWYGGPWAATRLITAIKPQEISGTGVNAHRS